jgi:8-oxo-dGTP pyrophosphatase MutT (NUDIX family)
MERFVVVVECAIELNNKFLMIKRPVGVHAAGFLAFPGGKVEYQDGGEKRNILAEAVKREVFEEVGLELIDPIRFVISSYFIDSHQEHVLDVIFHCKIEKTLTEVKPAFREVPEYYWLTKDEIASHENTPPWLRHYIDCL